MSHGLSRRGVDVEYRRMSPSLFGFGKLAPPLLHIAMAVRNDETVEVIPKLRHSQPERVAARRVHRRLVEPEVEELCELVVGQML